MNKKIFWSYFKLDMKFFLREPLFVMFTLMLPAILFYMFGSTLKGASYGGLTYVQRFLPSQISLILYAIGGFTLGFQIVTDKYTKVYKRLSITPLELPSMMISLFSRGLIITIISVIELFLIAIFPLHASIGSVMWFEFVVSTLLSAAMFFSLGFMIASLVGKPQHALSILLVLFYPMNMLSGSMFPIDTLPTAMKNLSKFMPQTYTNKIILSTWDGTFYHSGNLMNLLVVVAFTAVFIGISLKTFRWTED